MRRSIAATFRRRQAGARAIMRRGIRAQPLLAVTNRPPRTAAAAPAARALLRDELRPRRTTARSCSCTVDGDGAVGLGECVADADPYYSAETTETAWHIISDFLAPLVLGRAFAHPRDVLPALRARPRPPHGQGGRRDGGVGSATRSSSGVPLWQAARRQRARPDRVGRVDRHPGLARRARRAGRGRARGRLPAHQDQDQAGVGHRGRRARARAVRRRSR